MKKLMIAAAIVCVAAVSQAATVTWLSPGIQTTGDFETGDGDYAANYAVYLFADSVTIDFAADGWQDNFAADTKTYLGFGVTDAEGALAVSNATVADADFSGYLVIFDNADYTKAEYAFMSGTYTAKDNSMHKMSLDYDFEGYVNALDYSTAGTAGSNWQAVPEPTSGLLLLLGMAGLALKRRRA